MYARDIEYYAYREGEGEKRKEVSVGRSVALVLSKVTENVFH